MSETAPFHCPSCGAAIAQRDSFCPECGQRIRAANESPPGDTATGNHGQADSGHAETSNAGSPDGSTRLVNGGITGVAKLGPVEGTLAVMGLLAFISSFLPWYRASASVPDTGLSVSASTNAWSSGIGAWLPVLLLIALGILAVLPAFGVRVNLRGGYLLYAMAGAFAAVVIVIRWATYPSLGSTEGVNASAGAGIGTFLGLAAALVATALAWRGFVKAGGSLGKMSEAFARKGTGAD